MNFYSSIAQKYDYIFPVKQAQIDFIKSVFSKKTKLVEIGSGTGNLTIALANIGYSMSGLEYDENMLDLARKKSSEVSWNKEICAKSIISINEEYLRELFVLEILWFIFLIK